jgi:uncharacterized alkaline shock family protein YloU
MTEVAASRRYQFRLATKGNVKEIAKRIDKKMSRSVNKNRCEASVYVDPKDEKTIVVDMKCATGSDLYSVDRETILRIIGASEKDKIEHIIGPLEIET